MLPGTSTASSDFGTRFSHLLVRHWLLVIVAWVGAAALFTALAPRWDSVAQDGDLAYLPQDLPSIVGDRLLAEAFPQARSSSQIVLVFARPHAPLQREDVHFAEKLADAFRRLQADGTLPLRDVWTVHSDVVGRMLRSRDRHAALVALQLNTEFMAVENIGVLAEVQAQLAAHQGFRPIGLEIGITGSAAIGGDMLDSARESIEATEQTTILLVIIILLLVYRAPLLVLVPLATIAISLQVALPLVALLTQLNSLRGFEWWRFQVFKTTKIFVVVILYGAGTDYCLFLISRYKEELAAGKASAAAVAASLGNVSGALIGSGLTTILGLGMMFFADFGKYSNSGPAIAVCLSVALLACLTLAPALLAACGERIFWPLRISTLGNNQIQAPIADADSPLPRLKPAQRCRGRAERFWQAAADVLLARPGMVLAAAVLSMAPLAWRGSSVAVTYDLLSELNPQRPSVHGTALLRRHFPPGETSPITVLVHRASGGFDQKEGEIEVAHLTKFLYELTDDAGQRIAARVRSVTEPLGDVPGYVQPFTAEGLFKLAAKQHPLTKERFVTQSADLAGRVARLDVILRCDPFSAEAIRLLDELEEKVYALREAQPDSWGNAEFYFTGVTAGIRDLRAVTESDQNRIQILVVIAVLAVLLVLLRSPLVCVFLIFSVVWSYLVTLGLTELFFERLYGETYLGLDWKVPIFLFVILVAVGEDYNIYLVTRVLEEQQRLGPTAGLRAGLISTGGIITSCGVIMAGTFVSMTTGTLRGMIELGFALSLGVLLDTFVVRTVLVPAFLALMIRTSKAQPSTTDVRQSAESGVSPHEKRAS